MSLVFLWRVGSDMVRKAASYSFYHGMGEGGGGNIERFTGSFFFAGAGGGGQIDCFQGTCSFWMDSIRKKQEQQQQSVHIPSVHACARARACVRA